ncbi:hypothetical protein L2E82_02291 [Cichorium intybus]|uniref:Uncharacterized protein n=1 Tax=Cichorium intybus TaxID=13427 RepID=A0ACB9H168_CICIN|nr:hypothetical protein L2E82_02291 [Cichorium intybus]
MARWLQSAGLQHLASTVASNGIDQRHSPNLLMQGYGAQFAEEKQRLFKLMRNLNFNGEHRHERVEILPLHLSSGEDAIKEVSYERPKSTALDVPEASLKATLDVNVIGQIYLTILLLPYMLKRGKEHFVVMSSAVGKAPATGQAVYSASKFALNCYFYSLRSEEDLARYASNDLATFEAMKEAIKVAHEAANRWTGLPSYLNGKIILSF